MNKKLSFLVFCCIAAVPSVVLKSEQSSAVAMQGREVNEVQVDFEDFFNADGQEPRAVTRTKKKSLTKAQLVLIQVGISVAMGFESVYQWCKSLWLWVASYLYSTPEEKSSHEA